MKTCIRYNKMKYLLIALVLLSLSSCHDNHYAQEQKGTEKTEEIEEIANDSQYVSELINEKESTEKYNSDGSLMYLWYTLRLPKINISPEINDVINKDINEIFYLPSKKEIEKGCAAFDTNYKIIKKNDLLSLLVMKHSGFDVTGYTYYTATIDINKKIILSFDEACQKFGYDSSLLLSNIENYDKEYFYINENKEPVIMIFEWNAAYETQLPAWYNTITKDIINLYVP